MVLILHIPGYALNFSYIILGAGWMFSLIIAQSNVYGLWRFMFISDSDEEIDLLLWNFGIKIL